MPLIVGAGRRCFQRHSVEGSPLLMTTLVRRMFSRRTRSALRLDYYRWRARVKNQWIRHKKTPAFSRLHFGCGQRRIPGWINVDLVGSDLDIDLAAPLPWTNAVFDAVVSQQVIEHMEIESELMPLFAELARVTRPGAEIWLSCPDMEKVCRAYFEDRGQQLLDDRRSRVPVGWVDDMPVSHMINVMFHQGNEHKNLYDFELLKWLLERHGFTAVMRTDEASLRQRFPEFPARNDDFHALYVQAIRR